MLESVEKTMGEIVASLGDARVCALYESVPSGKRLRAKLILRIAGAHPDAVKLAAIVELIHAASLLHDDVIDDALTRRGVDSVNACFGNKTAIMLGDILYSKGFFELCALPSAVAQTISNAVALLSLGELQDVELSQAFHTDKTAYDQMIYNKTASLIEASAKAAAQLVGKPWEPFATYGRNLGLAFQVVDDILDITQDSQTLGKPALNDFAEGKTTLPYLYMYEALNAQDKAVLLSLFGVVLSPDQAVWIQEKMRTTGALARAIDHAKSLGKEALEAIAKTGVEGLDKVVIQMIEREF
ncbi:polyprenyl synthetase family protein [Sulfurospirillum sp. T05]|uniref:Polyprenyl synthetase family protein n=1 Tax=Sulfurospirillum tamanense TaxID=2813362 RepID=A0ABS2WRG0_9BACT|nr:polyprenyl synthetase family protein [Sulfurospirillum tamanensis]